MPNHCQKADPQRLKFTDLAVGRLKPGIYWDSLLPTFGIRVGATSRTWIVAVKGSKRKLGRYPAMTLADARAKAREMMEGGNSAKPADLRFSRMVEQFLEHGRTRKGRELRQNSIDQYRRNLRRYAAPLHQRPFAEITRRDIAELLRRIANESGAATASLTRSMLARLWSYGIETSEVEYNVVQNTPAFAVAKRSRVLSDGEIAAIWSATDIEDDYALILRLLLWTGARRGEAGGARWSELQSSNTTLIWHVPGSRVKNGRDLILPLPKQAAAALAQWPRVVGRDCLFGQTSSAGFNGWASAKARLDAQLGFDRDFDVHDIRRTVQTRLVGLGVNREVVNRILNHAMDPVTAAYEHYDYATEKREACRLWADKLEEIVSTAKPEIIKLNIG